MERTFILNPLSEAELEQLADREAAPGRIMANDWSHEFLADLPVLTKPAKLVLNLVHVGELRLPENATWRDIREVLSIQRRVAGPLPFEAVLPLRFAYQDQPTDEFLRLLHNHLGPNNRHYQFALYNNGQKFFVSARECGDADTVWPRSCLFGFMKSFTY